MEGIQPRYHIERYTRYHIERYKWYHIDRYERYHLSAILTMEGLFHDFTLKVADLRPAPTVDIQALELRQLFTDMQWKEEDE